MSTESGAVIDGEYRYVLWRGVAASSTTGVLLWVMLNPSTASWIDNDHTIRKVIGFTERFGFQQARVVNLYALRSRDPLALIGHPDPVGPSNDTHLRDEIKRAHGIVLAWGNAKGPITSLKSRAAHVRAMVHQHATPTTPIWRLNSTKAGHPGHPLMIGYNTQRIDDRTW